MLQLHQLIFSLNEGKTEIAQNTINELIEQTGDDPIYLMMFGKANFYAKNYKAQRQRELCKVLKFSN